MLQLNCFYFQVVFRILRTLSNNQNTMKNIYSVNNKNNNADIFNCWSVFITVINRTTYQHLLNKVSFV